MGVALQSRATRCPADAIERHSQALHDLVRAGLDCAATVVSVPMVCVEKDMNGNMATGNRKPRFSRKEALEGYGVDIVLIFA